MAINKRPDARPKSALKKYGAVNFGDPVNKVYPLDTAAHITAAWDYVHHARQRAKYTRAAWEEVCARIIAAWKAKIDPQGPPLAKIGKARKTVHDSEGRDSDAPDDAGAMQFLADRGAAPHFRAGMIRSPSVAALLALSVLLAALALTMASQAHATSFFGGAPAASATPAPLATTLLGYRAVSSWATTAGGSRLIGIELQAPVSFSHIGVIVNTADTVPTDYYDVGLYDASGTLQAHTGAVNLAATGYTDLPIAGGGTVTLAPGKYYMAFGGGAAATAKIEGAGGSLASYAINDGGGATTAGALPATMTPPADAWGETSWFLTLH